MATESTKSNTELAENTAEESTADATAAAAVPEPATEPSATNETGSESRTESKADPETEPQNKKAKKGKKDEENNPDKKEEKKDKPEFDVQSEFAALEQQSQKLNHKQSVALVTFENNLNRAQKFIAEGDEKLSALAELLRNKLLEILVRNREHQQALLEQSKEFINKLEKALEDGQSHEALSTWDKIQANLNNTTGEIKQSLQPLLIPFKTKIAELRDWKIFAATEKKKELIEQMKHLSESPMSPGDRSKHISKLHREWKTLGHSNQNEELWLAFKEASDKASESCKEFFKQRKQQMAENFKARQALCDELEQQFKTIKDESPALAQINKLLKKADDTWKQHAPVDHNKIKSLQKRYYDVVNELRKIRKSLVKNSAQAKKELIARASALLESEDSQQAMAEAKKLQQEWKQAGPGAYKDDKQLWEKFRGLCDQIFATRDKQKQHRRSHADDAKKQLQPLLKDLESLLDLGEEELREKRKQYQKLQQSFTAALDQLPGKQRSNFRDQFNGIKRKLESRYQALPDKKSQALLDRVHACTTYLQELETKQLNKTAGSAADVVEAFDQNHWQELIANINPDHQALLQQRADQLHSSEQQDKALDSARESFRQLCISAEIRASIDSPEEDQAKRMELQLTQLKQGFGQGQARQDKNADFIVNCRLDSLCLGPLSEEERKQFQDRLDKSLQRLF